MPHYRGIEKVDPGELARRHQITKSLWKSLNDHGVKVGSEGRINVFFIGDDESNLSGLTSAFRRNSGWNFEVGRADAVPVKLHVRLVSPKVRLSLEAFLELDEVMMVAAVEYSFSLDGYEVALHEVQHPPWWKFW